MNKALALSLYTSLLASSALAGTHVQRNDATSLTSITWPDGSVQVSSPTTGASGISNQSTLQAGATFYVSSGTIQNNFRVSDSDSVSEMQVHLSALPISGGFGPQIVNPFLYARCNLSSGSPGAFYIAASTVDYTDSTSGGFLSYKTGVQPFIQLVPNTGVGGSYVQIDPTGNTSNVPFSINSASTTILLNLLLGGTYYDLGTSNGGLYDFHGIESLGGDGSTFHGEGSGNLTHTRTRNTAFGLNTLNALTTGAQNTAFGALALSSLTSGSSNIAIGISAAANLTSTSNNIAIGDSANSSNSNGPGPNIAIGQNAINAITGGFNIGVGVRALDNPSTGNSADRNTGIGYECGVSSGGTSGTFLSENTFVGFHTYVAAPDLNNVTLLGARAVATSSNTVVLGAAAKVVVDGGFVLKSQTLTQLSVSTPDALGEMFYCSNCTVDGAVISTGTTASGSWGRISARTTNIQ